MDLVMEEIILTCLVLAGSVQIRDDVTLVCAPPTEEVVKERTENSDRERHPHQFPPPVSYPRHFEHSDGERGTR